MTSVILVQYSTNWANKPTGNWSLCWLQINPPSGEFMTVNIQVSYMWTAVEETKIEVILAVMNTTQLVVKLRPEKNSGPYEIWTHDLCDTNTTVFFFIIIIICTFLWQIIDKPQSKASLLHLNGSPVQRQVSPAFCQFSLTVFGYLKKNCCIGRGTGSQRSALPKNTAKLPWLQLEPHPQIEDLDKHT